MPCGMVRIGPLMTNQSCDHVIAKSWASAGVYDTTRNESRNEIENDIIRVHSEQRRCFADCLTFSHHAILECHTNDIVITISLLTNDV